MGEAVGKKKRHAGVGNVTGRQRVTMQDVARAAGCSQPTVSLVLNNNNTVKISDETKARVREAAKDLGYSVKAHPLRVRRMIQSPRAIDGPIGFVVEELSTSPEIMGNAFTGIRQATREIGNLVLLAETQNDPDSEIKTITHLFDQNVAAIVYATVFTRRIDVPEILLQNDTPVYLLNCFSDDHSFPSVIPGDTAGGHTATNALIKADHQRIATITGEPFMECARGRTAGYRNALASADLPFDDDLVVEGNWLPSSGYSGTQRLMALPSPPTAIFCQNDRMAIGCYEALKEMGLVIPDDVSVIGFDDDESARHLSPPLTSLILPARAMGRWVIEQFFHGSIEKQLHPLVKLECELVERDSIAVPSAI